MILWSRRLILKTRRERGEFLLLIKYPDHFRVCFGVSVTPADPLLAELETHNKEKMNNSWEPADPEQQLPDCQTKIFPLNPTTGISGIMSLVRSCCFVNGWQSTCSVVKDEDALLCIIIVWTRLQVRASLRHTYFRQISGNNLRFRMKLSEGANTHD